MVERPSFWLGIPRTGSPRPWREFPWHHGLMPNAFDILSHPELAGAVRLEGIARRLRFEGRIALDSGGYKFSDQNTVTIGAEEILALYRDCRPDYGVVLDHPLSPDWAVEAESAPGKLKPSRTPLLWSNTDQAVAGFDTSHPRPSPEISRALHQTAP